MKWLFSIAVIIALGAIGWTLGEQYFPVNGNQLGAFTGVVAGLLIAVAIRPIDPKY